jgi:hypothetical protein
MKLHGIKPLRPTASNLSKKRNFLIVGGKKRASAPKGHLPEIMDECP